MKSAEEIPENLIFFQGSLGYQDMLSLGSKYIASKVSQALQATASLYIHSSKNELKDLAVEKILLLSLVHSLMKKDVAACYIFTEISSNVESLKSPHLKKWLQDEFFFKYDDVRRALGFAAELTHIGLTLPAVVLSILENLYCIYCAPSKRRSIVDINLTENPSPTQNVGIQENEEKGATQPPTNTLILKEETTKTRKQNDFSHLKHTPIILPNRILGEYNHCEQFALQRENQILGEYNHCEQFALQRENQEPSPKEKSVPESPFPKDLTPTPSPGLYLRQLSGEFISKEMATYKFVFPNEPDRRGSDIIRELAAEADAINEKTGDTALHLAVMRNNLEAVNYIIRRGAIIDVENKAGVTPMQIAVERESLDIIRALHAAGAQINRKNKKDESLLHIAAAIAGVETIELLIELKADLDSLDGRKQTPLFRAAKKGYTVVMELLEGNGADILITDTYGRSLLHYAAWHGQVEAVEWLIKNGLKVSATTKHAMTPLHWAVANGQLKVALVLLKVGADVNARDSAKRTPLFWAVEAGNVALVDLLKSYKGVL